MTKYDIYIKYEFHSHEEYTLECDTDESVIDKANDMIIDGFASIEVDEPSYCYLNIMDGNRLVYEGRVYPCEDGVTEIK